MISEILEVCKAETLVDYVRRLEEFTREAARSGRSLHEIEQQALGVVLQIGKRNLDQFLQLQGDGDLGATVITADARTLRRSARPSERSL